MSNAARKILTTPIDEPRGYQREDIGKLKVACSIVRRVLYVAFMGTGKTIVASAVVREWIGSGEKVLFLTHRWEILKQTERKLIAAGLPRNQFSFHRRQASALYPVDLNALIHIASIDTLRNRGVILGITRIVIDEAHHVPSVSWTKLLALYPNAKIMGLTATPVRLDGKPLDEHFDLMIQQSESVETLIKLGWIAQPEILTRADQWIPQVKGLKKRGGDYSRDDAERVMSTIIGDIPAHWLRHAGGVPTVLFAASEKQIDDLLAQFKKHGVAADKLLGYDDDDARERKLGALSSGKIKVLCTCDVLGEGWDFPAARCVIMAAPTASLRRYLQWCGRAMRPGSKPLILDHAGNYHAHGPPWADQEWDLHARRGPTKYAASVDAEGRVTFREPTEIEGKLVHAELIRIHKICVGTGDDTPCPRRSVPPHKAFSPSTVAKRHGEPWRCRVCGNRRSFLLRSPEKKAEMFEAIRRAFIANRDPDQLRLKLEKERLERAEKSRREYFDKASKASKSHWARRTPEQRKEMLAKAWATRRVNGTDTWTRKRQGDIRKT